MHHKGNFIMKYVGSKNRLAKDLVPIIQSYIDKYHITDYSQFD